MRRLYNTVRALSAVGYATIFAVTVAAVSPARAGPVLPEFSPANFAPNAPVDNPYFPLSPGARYRYTATVTDSDGETVHAMDEDFVTARTEVVAGVAAHVVRARSWEDGVLQEDTFDWYAQDRDGNVWYLGEDTTSFEYDDAGRLVGTSKAGSWRAGQNGAKPGFIMPAHPTVGMSYYQEFAQAQGALDQAEVVSLDERVEVPAGRFENVLKTLETTEVEPGVREFKYYAPGVGQVLVEEDVNAQGEPGARFVLESVSTTSVPLPPAAWSVAAAGLVLLAPRGARAVADRVRRGLR